MKKTVLFVILGPYADWEYAHLANCLHTGIEDQESTHEVKTVSLTKDPVKSLGGFTTLPDFDINDYPRNYEALVLIGGNSWRTEEAKQIVPLVQEAIDNDKLLASICDSTVFLGMNGFLNDNKHTSNDLGGLQTAAEDTYTGTELYVHEQSVVDNNLITANGTAYLEFMRDILTKLEAFTPDYIQMYYDINKQGYVDWAKQFQ